MDDFSLIPHSGKWKERNHVIVEDTAFSHLRLKSSFVSSLTSWAGTSNMEEGPFVNLLCFLG